MSDHRTLSEQIDDHEQQRRITNEVKEIEREAYDAGFIDGLTCFARWYKGRQYVGLGETNRLDEAIALRATLWNYKP